jgi:LmbE family N-acetylglucosaminyl deacetylase
MPRAPRLLAVFAHPDDESLACGGTLARCAEAGVEVTLVCATRGEAGSIDPALGADRASLGALREAELHCAAQILGLHEVVVLGHRDGMLTWTDPARIEADLAGVIDRVAPDAVLTFGADGLYWHPDHIAIATRVMAVVHDRAERQPVVLYEVTMPPGAMPALVEAARASTGDAALAPWGLASEAFGKGALPPTLVIDVAPQIDKKLAALACHRSQFGPSNPLACLDRTLALAHLAVEHFHVAPRSPRGRGLLEELAERD